MHNFSCIKTKGPKFGPLVSTPLKSSKNKMLNLFRNQGSKIRTLGFDSAIKNHQKTPC